MSNIFNVLSTDSHVSKQTSTSNEVKQVKKTRQILDPEEQIKKTEKAQEKVKAEKERKKAEEEKKKADRERETKAYEERKAKREKRAAEAALNPNGEAQKQPRQPRQPREGDNNNNNRQPRQPREGDNNNNNYNNRQPRQPREGDNNNNNYNNRQQRQPREGDNNNNNNNNRQQRQPREGDDNNNNNNRQQRQPREGDNNNYNNRQPRQPREGDNNNNQQPKVQREGIATSSIPRPPDHKIQVQHETKPVKTRPLEPSIVADERRPKDVKREDVNVESNGVVQTVVRGHERHSATGRDKNEVKKGGTGSANWGSDKDIIESGLEQVQIEKAKSRGVNLEITGTEKKVTKATEEEIPQAIVVDTKKEMTLAEFERLQAANKPKNKETQKTETKIENKGLITLTRDDDLLVIQTKSKKQKQPKQNKEKKNQTKPNKQVLQLDQVFTLDAQANKKNNQTQPNQVKTSFPKLRANKAKAATTTSTSTSTPTTTTAATEVVATN